MNHPTWISRLPILFLLLLLGAFARGQFTLDREPPGPSSRKTGLVITEIMYNPRPMPGVDLNLTLQYIELYNSQPWAERLDGFAIGGDVRYVFPAETVLVGGGYLVVAQVPGLVAAHYGITNVFGPWEPAATARLSTERGVVQLRNRQGAVLLAINYQDSPPWPEAADGTGHSLCLARPSYGEDNFRAWAESDGVGGSPGGPDPVTADPLANVLINEWHNHSDPVDWVELYNHGNDPVDLSGAFLSDDPATNFFRIPDGTLIPPRGFLSYDQNQLGFELFAGGETVFFWSSNRTRIIDVIDFRGQSNNVSSGRSPDGGPFTYGLATRTRGGANSAPMRYPVIINEVMYNPPSGNSAEEYVELYNRSSRTMDLSGWEFVVGIRYVFPTNEITINMAPGAYWVVAKDPATLLGIHTNLTTNNTFGPYDGTLANGGERVVFTATDYDRVSNGGVTVIEKLPVPVSELNYADGGQWTHWSDGGGSSLELIDPEADTQHPANWADSNDAEESPWTAIEMAVPPGEALGAEVNTRLILMLQGVGECLVDEIEVRADDGPNLVANGGFESGLEGWRLQGSHDFSDLEPSGFAGSRSLHLRAGSRGDNQSNRVLSPPFIRPVPADARVVSIRAKARWLRGSRELLLRLQGSATEAYGRLAAPRRLGTPGAVNSTFRPNLGPAVYDVKHAPPLPAADQPVVVTARATDPQGLAAVALRYRIDPDPVHLDLPMRDDGAAGDAVAGDGLYSAVLPPQAGGTMAAFYVEARDPLNATGTFPSPVFPRAGFDRCWPSDGVTRECVVRWGDVGMPGDFATYHLWVTAVNSNRWHTRDAMNNTEMDGTFVYSGVRVIYNALPLYSGSPWHRTNSTTGPAGPNRVDYEMNFPDDDPLLGATDFVLNNPGNPDILTVSDLSALAEPTVYHVFEALGLPHNHRRYVHFLVNGSQRSTAHERPGNFIFEDSQQPNGDMVEQWFPDDAGGQIFKLDDWFEFDENGFDVAANNDADLARRTVPVDGQPTLLPAPYRFMFRKRSVGAGSADEFSALFELIDAISPADDPESATVDPNRLAAVADWEEWMRHFAVQRAVGNWDSYGWERGKNDYLYRGARGFVHMPWDIDYSLGLGRPADAPLFETSDPRIAALFNTPAIARAYWRAFADLVAGPFSNEYLDPLIDTRAAALTGNHINIDLDAVAAIKTYIGERRAFLQTQVAGVQAAFALEAPLNLTTADNLLVLTGTAPVQVKSIAVNGTPYPVTWISTTRFELRLVVQAQFSSLLIEGRDRFNQPVAEPGLPLEVTYTGPIVDPTGALAISEIMFAPATPNAQFFEILNTSTFNFDVSGWRFDGVNFVFPPGSIVTNRQVLVFAPDAPAFAAAYGSLPLFGVFGGSLSADGEPLALIRPGPMGDELIDGVRYEVVPPWPAPVPGAALQLVDPAQDNSRASNWTVDRLTAATPGAVYTTSFQLPPFDPIWLNEVQTENLAGPVDSAGEHEPWIELYHAGVDLVSLDGYYLTTGFTHELTRWAFPPGLALAPGEHLLVWADGEPADATGLELHTDFRLGYDGELALVRLVDEQPQITDHLAWTTPGANASYASLPDGQAVYRHPVFRPTPQAPNQTPVPPLFINEWMPRNTYILRDPADLDFDDWFEIYNGGPTPLDLGGFYLTDTTANPTRYRVPASSQYVVPPGGFLLVWADDEPGQNGPDQPDLHVNFKLAGDGGIIALHASDGSTVVDRITYGAQASDVSEGRYTDGADAIYAMGKATAKARNTIPRANTPPQFPAIPRQYLAPGGRLTFSIRANDPELPEQQLAYAYEPALEGTGVNTSGLFRWIVPTNQPPGDYTFILQATDNGLPPRSGTGILHFTITSPGGLPVTGLPPPTIRALLATGAQSTFTIETQPGRRYRVRYTDDLGALVWPQLGRDFVAANATASLTDTLAAPQRFYQVEVLE